MWQYFFQPALTALDSLWSNKIRSFITMLGIIIGVGAVVIIMAIGDSAQRLIFSQVEVFGSNLVGVFPGSSDEGGPPGGFTGFTVTTLTYDDLVAIRDAASLPHVTVVTGYIRGFGNARWRSESYDTSLNGTTASYLELEKGEVAEGRFFTEEEERNFTRVVVLGSAVKEQLFGLSDAIGQSVTLKNTSYRVIGVMKERGIVAFQDYDDQIIMPLRSAQRYMGVNHMGLMRMRVSDESFIDDTKEQLTVLLREQHDIRDRSGDSDDFTVVSSDQFLSIITSLTDSIRFFLAAMAGLSLVVGGIGIMNIMLISVTERTREIGLRKAIGARRNDILLHFLIEAIIVTLLGGIIGLLAGIIFSFFISLVVQYIGYDWEFIVSLPAIVLSLGVSATVGLVFGFFPAYKASRLDPIEALRYE